MGGVPVSALNLVAYPLETLGPEVLAEILRGGGDAVAAAGASIVGGHSIDDPEPKYGLAVTGTVHPDAILTNAGGRAGDALVLTKPLGAGTVATAIKRGLADDGARRARAIEVMTTLNDRAAEHARAAGAHALTDVTGLRAARPRPRAGGGERPGGRDRRGRRAGHRRRAGAARGRGRARRRLAAEPAPTRRRSPPGATACPSRGGGCCATR